MGRFARRVSLLLPAVLMAALTLALPAGDGGWAQDAEKPYRIKDGVVDWYTFSGFRRYHSECHVCHGPDALGSTFAPPLKDSMKALGYDKFLEVVVNGQEKIGAAQQSKMPAFGTNLNVMCFIDDLYVYLMARADEAIGRGRPRKKEAKSKEAREAETECFGG